MVYLVTQMFFCLLLAFVLGWILGWMLTRGGCSGRLAALEQEYKLQLNRIGPERANRRDNNRGASGLVINGSNSNSTSPSVMGFASGLAASGFMDTYPVEEIEGIGPAYGARLRTLQIETTVDLLEKCGESSEQESVSVHVKVEPFVVGKWVSMSDLMRIDGVRGQFAELLEACDINSVEELARQQGTVLAEKMMRINTEERRTPTVPSAEEVGAWIVQANSLPLKIKSLIPK